MSAYQRGNTIVRVNTQAVENNLTTQGNSETKPLDEKKNIFADKTNILKKSEKPEEPEEEHSLVSKQKFQYFIAAFIFFFFHFFGLILVCNIYRDLENYLDQDGKEFEEKFPELLPNAASLITFDVLLLVIFVLAIFSTIRLSMQSLNIFQIVFALFYVTKLGFEISFLGQTGVNDHIDDNLEKIENNDDYRLYCSGDDQVKCRFFLSWKFFYVNLIVDLIICTLAAAAFTFINRRFKIFLGQQELSVKTLQNKEDTTYQDNQANNQNEDYQGVLNDSQMNNSIINKNNALNESMQKEDIRLMKRSRDHKKDEFSVIQDQNVDEVENLDLDQDQIKVLN